MSAELLDGSVVWLAHVDPALQPALVDVLTQHNAKPLLAGSDVPPLEPNVSRLNEIIRHAFAVHKRLDAVLFMPPMPTRANLHPCADAELLVLFAPLVAPHLKRAANPHLLVQCPAPQADIGGMCAHRLASAAGSYALSAVTAGFAWEWYQNGVAVNGIWPHERNNRLLLAQTAAAVLGKPFRACAANFLQTDALAESEGLTLPPTAEVLTPMPFARTDVAQKTVAH